MQLIRFGEAGRERPGLLAAGGRALTGGSQAGAGARREDRGAAGAEPSPDSKERPDQDRFREPLFLAIWYAGLLTGYLKGPARSRRYDGRGGDRKKET